MPRKLITPPAAEPITLDETKAHLRVDFTDDDAYITALIPACRELYEKLAERALMPQTWDIYFDQFSRPWAARFDEVYYDYPERLAGYADARPDRSFTDTGYLEIAPAPVASITSVKYIDVNGAEQILDPTLYQQDLISEPSRLYPAYGQAWPASRLQRNAVYVRAICGYVDAASVPNTAKLALKAFVAHFYENREPVSMITGVQPQELPMHLQQLIDINRTASSWV